MSNHIMCSLMQLTTEGLERMITLLARIFIKEADKRRERKLYGTICSVVGILLNVFLFAGKFFAGYISGSVAVTADAFNNLSDAGSSFITLVGFAYAEKKPDSDHPFGHGRFEYISGFLVSIAIVFMGFELLKSSISKIIKPEPVDTGIATIVILIVSILVKLYMAFYNKRIGKKIDSAAMQATSMDALSDSVATLVVLIAMLVMRFTGINIDGYCGVLVALFIFYAGYKAAKDTIDPLLGFAPEKEFVEEIENIVLAHEKVVGIHDLVVHDYGPGRRMISLHAEVPGDENMYEIHDLIDLIERELHEKTDCQAVIHMDPIETNNEEIVRMKNEIAALVKSIDERITIHDFRMVSGPTHTNLIFDAVVPFEIKKSVEDVKKEIEQLIMELPGSYFAVIDIDRTYVL